MSYTLAVKHAITYGTDPILRNYATVPRPNARVETSTVLVTESGRFG